MAGPESNDPSLVETLTKEDPKVKKVIDRIRAKEIEIAELFALSASLVSPRITGLISTANRMMISAKFELNLPDSQIPRSQFKKGITAVSLKHVDNYLAAIDINLEAARSLIRDPRTINPRDFNSEWLNTD